MLVIHPRELVEAQGNEDVDVVWVLTSQNGVAWEGIWHLGAQIQEELSFKLIEGFSLKMSVKIPKFSQTFGIYSGD